MTQLLFASGEIVLLRCDAGAKHGLGHLSRCMTLAATLSNAGAELRLVLHAPDSIKARVIEAGYTVVNVDADVGADNPADWLASDVCLLVIDSKEVIGDYVELCRTRCAVACFDDEISRILPCDMLINNNVWANRTDYQSFSGRRLLMGPLFNTVNPAYFALVGRRRNGLLITLGGEDPHNHTAWLVKTLANKIGNLPTHVCIGPAHPDPGAVVQSCKDYLPHAAIHCAPASLLDVAAQCHIALSAGGTTCYELSAAGIAMAVLAVEDHQSRLQSALERAGAALSLGAFDALNADEVLCVYDDLINPLIASRMVAAGKQLFPNPGVGQIVKAFASTFSRMHMTA